MFIIVSAPSGIGREALVGGTGAARERCEMLPHLLVVGAGNSRDPAGPAGRGRRLSGERSVGGGRPIGDAGDRGGDRDAVATAGISGRPV